MCAWSCLRAPLRTGRTRNLLLGGRIYPVDYGQDGGLEVIAGEPIRVDAENIGYWKDQI